MTDIEALKAITTESIDLVCIFCSHHFFFGSDSFLYGSLPCRKMYRLKKFFNISNALKKA